jgi:hypothetical protein
LLEKSVAVTERHLSDRIPGEEIQPSVEVRATRGIILCLLVEGIDKVLGHLQNHRLQVVENHLLGKCAG